MQCPKCNSENPDNKKFCGDCGNRLLPSAYLSEDELRAQIRAVIKEELTDQKVVEVEITESVLERITGWAKKLGFFAGIPLALLLLVLGLLGLKKYSDLWALASAAENKIGPVVERAQKTASDVEATTQRLQQRSSQVESQIAALKPKLETISKDAEHFAQLEKNVDGRFESLQASLDSKLNKVQGQVKQIQERLPCGIERWSIKTGTDADAGKIDLAHPKSMKIADMIQLTPPHPIPPDERVAPTETTVWVVNATLTDYKHEAGSRGDNDYHLILEDDRGNTMVAEIPSPNCVGDTSPLSAQIATARAKFDAKLTASPSFQSANIPVQITGVGMFDFPHGQHGASPNGIELHPVLDIVFTPSTPTRR